MLFSMVLIIEALEQTGDVSESTETKTIIIMMCHQQFKSIDLVFGPNIKPPTFISESFKRASSYTV